MMILIKNGLLLFLIFLPMLVMSKSEIFSWKATYYAAIPNKPGITLAYCKRHEPGTFIGKVAVQLKQGAITDRGIKLTHFTFKSLIKNGIYFMQGTVDASGMGNSGSWNEQIHYYVYKLTEKGITYGVWSSAECKGLYRGEPIATFY